MSIVPKIAKNALSLISGRMISRVLQFFLFIFAARILGADDFGLFSYAFALVGIMGIFMDMGVSRYTVQQLSRTPEKVGEFLGGCFILKAMLIIVGLALILIAGPLLQKDSRTLGLVIILGTYTAFDSLTLPFYAVFQADERMDYQAMIVVIANTLMCLTGFLLLFIFHDLLIFSLAYLCGGVLRFLLSAWWTLKKYGRPAFRAGAKILPGLFKKSLPFALVSIFITLYYYIDTLILSAYSTKEIVGYYNAAYRLVDGPLFLVGALTTAMFPALSKLFSKDRSKILALVRNSFFRITIVGLAVCVPVAFFAAPIIRLVYTNQYIEAARVLPILIFALAVILPNSILGTTIRAIDRQAISAWVVGFGAAFNIIANLIVIPRYSFYGAAWTTLLTEIFILIAYCCLTWKYLGLPIDLAGGLRILGFTAFASGFLFLTTSLGWWIQAAIYCVIAGPTVYVFGGFGKQT